MKAWRSASLILGLALNVGAAPIETALLSPAQATTPEPVDRAPSKEKVQWLGSLSSYSLQAEYDYVGSAATTFGDGTRGRVAEHYTHLNNLYSRRFYRAFLVNVGVEWQHYAFYVPQTSFVPHQLNTLNAYAGLDFRFSRRDLVRVQTRPGYYSDWGELNKRDVNVTVDYAYMHVFSNRFQAVVGVSDNPWREKRWLGGGGFRWKINDRWKLKFLMPEPKVEYQVREDLNVFTGAEFRSDSFRVSDHFGTERGNPKLDSALLDYREIRLGTGFSWNIFPLLEFNMAAGVMLDRQYKYHAQNIRLNSDPAPYITMSLQWLCEIADGAPKHSPEHTLTKIETPVNENIIKPISK